MSISWTGNQIVRFSKKIRFSRQITLTIPTRLSPEVKNTVLAIIKIIDDSVTQTHNVYFTYTHEEVLNRLYRLLNGKDFISHDSNWRIFSTLLPTFEPVQLYYLTMILSSGNHTPQCDSYLNEINLHLKRINSEFNLSK